MSILLVIDDDTSILHAFRRTFRGPEVTLLTAATAAEGLDVVRQRQPDVVILDINLPDLSGLEAFRRIRGLDARIPVIFITGHGTTDTAIEAMKLGAFDYLLKPLELAPLRELVDRALAINRQAQLPARAIYHHSRRATGPFLAINCAAIPETLLESELFGHEKGAFTGAERKRIGKFEQCHGGTILLDEIGDMTPLTQTKILRVLQEQRFERVGGNETIQTDVRLLAATNCDLEQMVASGQFRGD